MLRPTAVKVIPKDNYILDVEFDNGERKEFDGKRAWYIFKRDRYNHASPNSAQTEAVCAGALGIRLAGNASYFGKIVEKPYIGDAERAVETEDIRRANRLLYATAILCEAICLSVLWIILLIS